MLSALDVNLPAPVVSAISTLHKRPGTRQRAPGPRRLRGCKSFRQSSKPKDNVPQKSYGSRAKSMGIRTGISPFQSKARYTKSPASGSHWVVGGLLRRRLGLQASLCSSCRFHQGCSGSLSSEEADLFCDVSVVNILTVNLGKFFQCIPQIVGLFIGCP
jgi:hypothetical protein